MDKQPIFYLLKELIYKFICFILSYLLFCCMLFYYSNSIIFLFLSPFYNEYLYNHVNILYSYYDNEEAYDVYEHEVENYFNENGSQLVLPTMEINIPFFASSYFYMKYLFFVSFYFIIPIFIYLILLGIKSILKKREFLVIFYINIIIIILMAISFLFNHYVIIPEYLCYIFSHFTEVDLYEFDVEFNIEHYLILYFKLLYSYLVLILIFVLKNILNNLIPSNSYVYEIIDTNRLLYNFVYFFVTFFIYLLPPHPLLWIKHIFVLLLMEFFTRVIIDSLFDIIKQ